jgi:hypothetical protein
VGLSGVTVEQASMQLHLTATAPTAPYSGCAVMSLFGVCANLGEGENDGLPANSYGTMPKLILFLPSWVSSLHRVTKGSLQVMLRRWRHRPLSPRMAQTPKIMTRIGEEGH